MKKDYPVIYSVYGSVIADFMCGFASLHGMHLEYPELLNTILETKKYRLKLGELVLKVKFVKLDDTYFYVLTKNL